LLKVGRDYEIQDNIETSDNRSKKST